MIKIGNIASGAEGEYCARPSVLGNPFHIHGDMTRKYVCDMYDSWLYKKIDEQDHDVLNELTRLDDIYIKTGELTLLCFCAPLRCHCETIKKVLEDGLFIRQITQASTNNKD